MKNDFIRNGVDSVTPDQDGLFTLRTASKLKEVDAICKYAASVNLFFQVTYLGLADLGKSPSVTQGEVYIQVFHPKLYECHPSLF